MDNSSIHPMSQSLAHLIDLFAFQGAPHNKDTARPVQILINHGFAVGFSPDRLQPVWAAYRVALATRDVKYDRPHRYYDDQRLDAAVRITANTFGKKDEIPYHVGHMVPNEAINTQFGRLAQMETFFMSNMSPQRGSLNTGVWLDLENKIRNIEDTSGKDHVWALVGPIFGADPQTLDRPGGLSVPVPDAYFCVLADPFRYPWHRRSNVDVAALRIPQDAERNTPLDDFLVDLAVVEAETQLELFPGWNTGAGAVAPVTVPSDDAFRRHRLLRQLR